MAFPLHELGEFGEAECGQAAPSRLRAALVHEPPARGGQSGPRHPVTVSVQLLQARARAAAGHLPEAVDLMAQAVTGREETLGLDHPYIARAREILAELRSELADLEGPTTP